MQCQFRLGRSAEPWFNKSHIFLRLGSSTSSIDMSRSSDVRQIWTALQFLLLIWAEHGVEFVWSWLLGGAFSRSFWWTCTPSPAPIFCTSDGLIIFISDDLAYVQRFFGDDASWIFIWDNLGIDLPDFQRSAVTQKSVTKFCLHCDSPSNSSFDLVKFIGPAQPDSFWGDAEMLRRGLFRYGRGSSEDFRD